MGRRLRIMSGRGRAERQWPIGSTGFARLWSNPPPASRVSTEVDGDPGPIRTGDLPLRRGKIDNLQALRHKAIGGFWKIWGNRLGQNQLQRW